MITPPGNRGGRWSITSSVETARCTIEGTPGPDELEGTPGPNVICGYGGDDSIVGLAGDDVLRGGTGFDWLQGGFGEDTLGGGGGSDFLRAAGHPTGSPEDEEITRWEAARVRTLCVGTPARTGYAVVATPIA